MSENRRILVVEDEARMLRFLELELSHEGFEVICTSDGRDGLARSETEAFDLILLDVMLPGLNGTEVCRRIRRRSSVPIIMLTAKGDISDKVMGLEVGADDYVTKPFEIEELLARIRASLRRAAASVTERHHEYRAGDLSVNVATRRVVRGEAELSLTKREFELLEYLIRHKGIVLSRSTLLENVWGWDREVDTNSVDVYIRYLRRKVDDPFETRLIETVRGFGYTLRDPDE